MHRPTRSPPPGAVSVSSHLRHCSSVIAPMSPRLMMAARDPMGQADAAPTAAARVLGGAFAFAAAAAESSRAPGRFPAGFAAAGAAAEAAACGVAAGGVAAAAAAGAGAGQCCWT